MQSRGIFIFAKCFTDEPIFTTNTAWREDDVITFFFFFFFPSISNASLQDNYSFLALLNINKSILVLQSHSAYNPVTLIGAHCTFSLWTNLFTFTILRWRGGGVLFPHVNVAHLKNYSGLCDLCTHVCHIFVWPFKEHRNPWDFL